MKLTCPKCHSTSAWLRKTEYDLLLVCMCGYQKLLFTTLVDTIEGPLEDELEDEPKNVLPKPGTAFRQTLLVVWIMPGGTSLEITERLNELMGLVRIPGKIFKPHLRYTVSDVSSYLTILGGKGWVEREEIRRGVRGGSTWVLTPTAIELLEQGD